MGIQEVFMVHGEEAVVAALKSPDLTGWPIHVRSRVGERRIDWRRVENDIKQALEGSLNLILAPVYLIVYCFIRVINGNEVAWILQAMESRIR